MKTNMDLLLLHLLQKNTYTNVTSAQVFLTDRFAEVCHILSTYNSFKAHTSVFNQILNELNRQYQFTY